MSKPLKSVLCAIWVLVAALMLSGCATVTAPPPEEAVLERAQERLDLLLAEDLAGAYEYLSPGYRSGVTLPAYQREVLTRPVRWTSARAVASDCSEDVCNVRIALEFEVYAAVPGMSRFKSPGSGEERWLRIDGQWYYVPKT
ncbi:MAG: hypothetical protein V2I57_03295 [Xanthomonadales bacterium]|jgi:hypothetical protein|nr:hypothetical protein [Xanthomonadales bacterium]